jgi:IS6 family transposase
MGCVKWYLRYCLSYRDLVEMVQERDLGIVHSTICRCIQCYSKELERKIRPHFRIPNGSWRVDETYIKVKSKWHYLYRAVDKYGDTIDFYLSQTRTAEATKRFFTKALDTNGYPSVMTVDKNPAYPVAIEELQTEKKLPADVRLRQVKYPNNIVEQDHRRIKRKSRYAMG